MKNIHVLPTDKPSRLVLDANNILVLAWNKSIEENAKYKKNIYITNDEEIKEGDWCLNTEEKNGNMNPFYGKLYKANKSINKVSSDYIHNLKKIILTTDPSLAPDVQKIDDEFLEWFVKNPSCEDVEVIKEYFWEDTFRGYSLRLPKEEPNPFELPKALPDDVFYESLEPKKETLEEAGVAYAKTVNQNHTSHMLGFLNGAKWQQERSYSEEEVKNLTELFLSYYFKTDKGFDDSFDEWFEQFKKK